MIIFVIDYNNRMEFENLVLTEIKSTVCRFLPEAEVILFGSRARGDNQYNSDYDILVVVQTSIDSHQRLQFQALIRKDLANQNILADIFVRSLIDIERKKNLPGHFLRSAMQEGVRV